MTYLNITNPADMFGQPSLRRFATIGPLPINGYILRIRSVTQRESANIDAANFDKKGIFVPERAKDTELRWFKTCVVDTEGNSFLSNDQLEKMRDWDSADTAYLFNAITAHCGLNKASLEELVKNSATPPAAD